jgi:hypothetical protein
MAFNLLTFLASNIGKGRGEGVSKWSMGVRNFNLRRSQIKKRGKIVLNQ